MANIYIIYSKETFEDLSLPAWVANVHGWPDEQVIQEADEEAGEVEISMPWSLSEGCEALGLSAGNCIPVIDDGVNLIRSDKDSATDFVLPYGSVGGDFHMWIKSLADAKPIAYEVCVKSVKQTRDILISEEDNTPEPL
jgi:hypothetical protein